MGQAYFITGTGTDIGKTIVTSFLYKVLKKLGIKVTILKPFQTGYRDDLQGYPDIQWFESKLGIDHTGVYQLEPETSPHLAIRLTNKKIDEQVVLNRIQELKKEFDVVLVEGAGGLAVPLIEKETNFYMTKDLILEACMPIIMVSTSGLGAIHHTLTTFLYAKTYQLHVKSLIFNMLDYSSEIHQDNIQTIEKLLHVSILASLPVFSTIETDMDCYIDHMIQNNRFVEEIQEVFDCAIYK